MLKFDGRLDAHDCVIFPSSDINLTLWRRPCGQKGTGPPNGGPVRQREKMKRVFIGLNTPYPFDWIIECPFVDRKVPSEPYRKMTERLPKSHLSVAPAAPTCRLGDCCLCLNEMIRDKQAPQQPCGNGLPDDTEPNPYGIMALFVVQQRFGVTAKILCLQIKVQTFSKKTGHGIGEVQLHG